MNKLIKLKVATKKTNLLFSYYFKSIIYRIPYSINVLTRFQNTQIGILGTRLYKIPWSGKYLERKFKQNTVKFYKKEETGIEGFS